MQLSVQHPLKDPAQDISWTRLPSGPIVLGWLDSSSARQRITYIFTTLSSLSLGATVYVAVKFTAVSLAGTYIASGLALFTLANCIAAFAVYKLKPSPAEIDWNLRQDAKKNLNCPSSNRLGYEAMRKQYPEQIVSEEEANKLMFIDAHTLIYPRFIEKHGSNSIKALDVTNKSALKPSFISQEREKYSQVRTFSKEQFANQILNSEEGRILGVTHRDIDSEFATFYVAAQMTSSDAPNRYEQFLKLNDGVKGIGLVNDPHAKRWLGKQFVSMISNLIHTNGPGLIELRETHAKALEAFDEETRTSFQKTIFQRDIKRFQTGSISLEQLAARNGVDAIRDYLKEEQALKGTLRSQFLKSPYSSLISPSEADLSIFDLKLVDIQQGILKLWDSVSFAQPDAIRALNLFDSIGKVGDASKIPANKLTAKALRETSGLSVFQIAKEIFETGVLKADSKYSDETTIKERLQKELAGYKKLEDFEGIGQSYLFEHGLLSKDDPVVQKLIQEFIKKENSGIDKWYEENMAQAAAKRDEIKIDARDPQLERVEQLKKKLKALSEKMVEIQGRYELEKEALDKINKEKDELEEQEAKLQKKISDARDCSLGLQQQVSQNNTIIWKGAKTFLDTIKQKHEEVQATIKTLKKELKQVKAKRQELLKKSVAKTGTVEDERLNNNKNKKKIEKTKGKIKKIEEKIVKDEKILESCYAVTKNELNQLHKDKLEKMKAKEDEEIRRITLMVMGEC